jgi:hypothetical protein
VSASSTVGKAWGRGKIRALAPSSIVDIGAGRGTYYNLLRDVLPNTYWIAVEVFEPYVAKYRLRDKYDEVIVADVRYLDWGKVGAVDVAICGDIIEHMPQADALRMWSDLRSIAKYLLLSVPLGDYPQGSSAGNRFEAHMATWTLNDCLGLPGVYDHAAYSKIGVFLARGAQVWDETSA